VKKEITIDGIPYVEKKEAIKGMRLVLVRTYSAGVHFGYLKEKEKDEVTLVNTKRIYSWSGACSLSQIAVDGVDPDKSKISVEVSLNTILGVIEIIDLTEKAYNTLIKKTWKI
jgi:hypothetical protein